MRDLGLTLENPAYVPEGARRPLEGLTFVFTGSLESMTRGEAKDLVEKQGARAASSVSKNTDYLVAGPGAGSKLDQAGKHGVKVLSEAEFQELLESKT
jgi:DNA ligase (NAD+)